MAPNSAIGGLLDEKFNPALTGAPSSVLPLTNGEVLIMGPAATSLDGPPFYSVLQSDGTPDFVFNFKASAARFLAGPPIAFLQADGRIVLTYAGQSPTFAQLFLPAWSVRLNPDGSPDETYAPHAATYQGVPYQDALPAFQLSNGDYLSLPGAGDMLDTSGGLVRRLASNGALDSTFTPWAGYQGTPGLVAPVAFDTHGRPWIGAQRLNADGSPDSSFKLAVPAGAIPNATMAVGDQLLVAYTIPADTDGPQTGLARLNSDGSLDSTYGGFLMSDDLIIPEIAAFAPDGSAYLTVIPNSGSQEIIWTANVRGRSPARTRATVTPALTTYGFYQGTYRSGLMRFSNNGAFDPNDRLNDCYDLALSPTGMVFASGSQMYAWGYFQSFNSEARAYLVRLNMSAGDQSAAVVNVSARATTGSGSAALTAGFIVAGTGSDAVLVRGVGPSLTGYGVSDALAAAQLTLFDGQQAAIASNSDWQSSPSQNIAAVSQLVGAFPLTGAGDAALLVTLTSGDYTAQVTGDSGATGVALAEVYDVNLGNQPRGAAHLSNVSARAPTSSGINTLTVGFVVSGPNNQRVLIRATGPGLLPFGVTGALPDPELKIFAAQTLVADDTTADTDPLAVAATQVIGAFEGADVETCLTLAPGTYTAEVASQSGVSGVALLEVYEVP